MITLRGTPKQQGRSQSDRQIARVKPPRAEKKRRSPTVRTFYALAERPFANKRRFACLTRNRQNSFSAELIDDGPAPLRQRANVVGALKGGPVWVTSQTCTGFFARPGICDGDLNKAAVQATALSCTKRASGIRNAPWTQSGCSLDKAGHSEGGLELSKMLNRGREGVGRVRRFSRPPGEYLY